MTTPNIKPSNDPADESALADIAAEHPIREGFTICDEASANWVARKIVEARAYAQHVAAWAEQEKARAEREEQFFLWRFGGELQRWAAQQIKTTGGKRKSVSLPAGTLGFRQLKAKLVVDDERCVLAWARAYCPAAVKVRESLSKTEINDHVEATGELPDGVHLEPEREHFYIK